MLTSLQAEWDRYFPIEQNTGDLNIPDFDFNNFTGGIDGPSLDPNAFTVTASSIADNLAADPGDFADINFTPTFYPDITARHMRNVQGYQNQ